MHIDDISMTMTRERHPHSSGQGLKPHAQQAAQAQGATAEPFTPQQTVEALEQARIHTAWQGLSLEITVHEDSGRLQVAVLDAQSGKVVRKIPEDEVLELARRIREFGAQHAGPLLDRAL
ncbi:MAG: flagellar protein FlaG [Desulfovibrio sp.]|jgi:flagellar protein FlaG|nr:flagellar protein FlaG [Desulfovibrio sp.]